MSQTLEQTEQKKVVKCSSKDGSLSALWMRVKHLFNDEKIVDECIAQLADSHIADSVKIGSLHWLSKKQLILLEKKLSTMQSELPQNHQFSTIQSLFNKQILGASDEFWHLITYLSQYAPLTDEEKRQEPEKIVQTKDFIFEVVEEVAQPSSDQSTSFDVSGLKLTEEALRNIHKVSPQLESLTLKMCSLEDSSLSVLQDFQNLQSLDLTGNPITDEGLKTIGKLHNLTELRLDVCPITGEGLSHLQNLTNLKVLSLKACLNILEEDFSALQPLQALHSLDLTRTKFSDEQFGLFLHLKELKNLSLGSLKLNGKGFQSIRETGVLNLTSLDLSGCFFTDLLAEEIHTISSLQHLNISYCRLTNDLLAKATQGLVHLETLDISWNYDISAEGLLVLSNLPELHTLKLSGCKKITDHCLQVLRSIKKLSSLNIYGCNLTNQGLDALSELPELHTLALLLEPMKGINYLGISRLKNCCNLRHLTVTVDSMKRISMNLLLQALIHLQKLESIEFLSAIKGADAMLLAPLQSLKKLIFTNTPKELFTTQSLKELQSALPELVTVWQRREIVH